MRYAILAAVILTPALAAAQAGPGPKQNCVDLTDSTTQSTNLIAAQGMDASRSLSINRDNATGGYDLLTLWVNLTDANTSITRFDVTCTVSHDGNSTDYTPQECTSASGTYTCVGTGIWQKASPGTSKFPLRLDVSGFPDIECTFSVGAGAGASIDLLTVKGRLCTGG